MARNPDEEIDGIPKELWNGGFAHGALFPAAWLALPDFVAVRGSKANLGRCVSPDTGQNCFAAGRYLLALMILLQWSPAATAQASYSVAVYESGAAFHINNNGQAVGYSNLRGFPAKTAALFSNGTTTLLGTLRSSGVGLDDEATGINDNGQIAGYATTADQISDHAFVYSNGTMKDLGTLGNCVDPNGNAYSRAFGINQSGVVVGYSTTSILTDNGPNQPQTCHTPNRLDPFIYSNGIMTDLATTAPGLADALPAAINDRGDIAGHLSNGHPFLYNNGTITDLGSLGGPFGYVNGLNNTGQVVGYFSGSDNISHAFLYSGGVMTLLGSPNGSSVAYGINSKGQVVGVDANGPFIYSNGTLVNLNLTAGQPFAINDLGQLAGIFEGQFAAIFTPQIAQFTVRLVDPVPTLLNGPQITSAITAGQAVPGQPYLADLTKGRIVQGIATDGVAQVVLQISAASVGQTFTLAVRPDQCNGLSNADCVNQYGLIFDPSNPPANLFNNPAPQTVVVTAVSTTNGPMAFAGYRAPLDFVRPGSSDAGDALRSAFISINNGAVPDAEVKLVRPPIVLIHGLWGDGSSWDSFSTLKAAPFSAGTVSYDALVPSITASNPDIASYSPSVLSTLRQNSFGFFYNAPTVLTKLKFVIDDFGFGNLPNGMFGPNVASVQADIVAHSMGGNIARALPLISGFDTDDTYGQGIIHKLITIGTPHLGTPVAGQLLQSANTCVRNHLAVDKGFMAADTFLIGTTGPPIDGAVGDLQGDGAGGGIIGALADLQASNNHPIPTGLIVGVTNTFNLAGLDGSGIAIFLRTGCGMLAGNPLANVLTSAGWNTIFSGHQNDGIVPLSSASNNVGTFFEVQGLVHSIGTEGLGFNGPSLLDSTQVINNIITLLNANITQSGMFLPLRP